jgi:hypothetical protein
MASKKKPLGELAHIRILFSRDPREGDRYEIRSDWRRGSRRSSLFVTERN